MSEVTISATALGLLCGSLGFFGGLLIGMFLVATAWTASDEKKKDAPHA